MAAAAASLVQVSTWTPRSAEQILGIHHDVEQMRHRRALVAADIAHARLQQRLGDREDALAAKRLAVAQPQRIHFLLERAFHRVSGRIIQAHI